MGIQSENALCDAFKLIEICNISEASEMLKDALTINLDDESIVFAIKCCGFWIDTLNSIPSLSSFEQGETLLNQWKQFVFITGKKAKSTKEQFIPLKKEFFRSHWNATARRRTKKTAGSSLKF